MLDRKTLHVIPKESHEHIFSVACVCKPSIIVAKKGIVVVHNEYSADGYGWDIQQPPDPTQQSKGEAAGVQA